MSEKRQRIWVHPEFVKKLKREAINRGKSVLKVSEELSCEDDFLKPEKWKKIRL